MGEERPVEPFSDLHVEEGHVRATLLHELASGGRSAAAEEEMRKRLRQLAQLGAGGGGGSGGAPLGGGAGTKSRRAPRTQTIPATAASMTSPVWFTVANGWFRNLWSRSLACSVS